MVGRDVAKEVKASQPIPLRITEKNIDQVEQEILRHVNKTISQLEEALAVWEASGEKPEALRPKAMEYKQLHAALSQWEKKVLQYLGKKPDFRTRSKLLEEFAEICGAYVEGHE